MTVTDQQKEEISALLDGEKYSNKNLDSPEAQEIKDDYQKIDQGIKKILPSSAISNERIDAIHQQCLLQYSEKKTHNFLYIAISVAAVLLIGFSIHNQKNNPQNPVEAKTPKSSDEFLSQSPPQTNENEQELVFVSLTQEKKNTRSSSLRAKNFPRLAQ